MSVGGETFRQTPYWLQFGFSGNNYITFHRFIDIGIGSTAFIQLDTGAKLMHLVDTTIQSNSNEILIEVFEGGTSNNDGTAVPMITSNREVLITPPTVGFFDSPTGVSVIGATKIDQIYIPGSAGIAPQDRGGGFSTLLIETILKKNETYIYRLTNNGGAAATIQLNWFWYESGN